MTDNQIESERHRFCPSCGTEAVGAGSFCSECGGSLIKPTENGDLPPAIQTAVPTASPPPPPPPPQPSTVAVAPTQPPAAAGTVPPPLQTPLISPSGKKPLRRQPVFWIAIGVVLLVIIAGISAVLSGSHSQSYGASSQKSSNSSAKEESSHVRCRKERLHLEGYRRQEALEGLQGAARVGFPRTTARRSMRSSGA